MGQAPIWEVCLTVGGQIANVIIAAWTIKLWQEAKAQRVSSQLPLLAPCKLKTLPEISGGLFCGNFHYPRADDGFKDTGLLYLGIKNIGHGLAQDVSVISFTTDGKEHPNCGHQRAHIPPTETSPLVIRYGYMNADDLDRPHNILIRYQDIFGGVHHLQVQLWFENLKGKTSAEAVVIRFSENSIPIEGPPVPIFREMEYSGYYELQKIAKDHKLR